MSTVTAELIRTLSPDERRGELGMLLFIVSEVALFISLFFSYFLLGADKPHWPTDEPPKMLLALIMLVILAESGSAAGRQQVVLQHHCA